MFLLQKFLFSQVFVSTPESFFPLFTLAYGFGFSVFWYLLASSNRLLQDFFRSPMSGYALFWISKNFFSQTFDSFPRGVAGNAPLSFFRLVSCHVFSVRLLAFPRRVSFRVKPSRTNPPSGTLFFRPSLF